MANLKPTGRNLALATSILPKYIHSGINYFEPFDESAGGFRAPYNSEYGISKVREGGTFTVSYDYEITGVTTAFRLITNLKYDSFAYQRFGNSSDSISIPIGNSSGHVEITAEPIYEQMKYGESWLFSGVTAGQNINVELTIRNFKFETGDKATPWKPAPEDIIPGGSDFMILALNTITLTTVTDIQGIYRYYYLGTSKPSVPSAYPPPSPWVSTEPNFDLSNQGSLYYIDCTLFNDLTFQYGEVQISSDYEAVKKTYADALQQIENSKQEINSNIQKNNDMIRTEVSETYYSKDEMDTQLGQVSTALEQTKNSFEMQFNSFQTDLENLNDDNTAKFQQIFKYIRFEDGNIILGESGNELTLTIENDQIAFKQNGQVVAYFTNNKLYVTDGEFVHTLRIGSFIYSPRPDGSLDFKKG